MKDEPNFGIVTSHWFARFTAIEKALRWREILNEETKQ
jgi:hypothetical protein